jgi:hypothetical protein
MDLFQVATFDCVVNLSADGEAAPSQHNQQEDSPAEKLHFVVAHNNFLLSAHKIPRREENGKEL